MRKKKLIDSQPGQPILSYTSTSERAFELPQDTTRTLEQFAQYYSSFSGMKINPSDVLASKAVELYQSSKELIVEDYKPPKGQSITLPNGAWAGIDKAAKEKEKSTQEIIIAIAKKLSRDEHFLTWLSRERGAKKRRKKTLPLSRKGASTADLSEQGEKGAETGL